VQALGLENFAYWLCGCGHLIRSAFPDY
jgi:hypothetical protein